MSARQAGPYDSIARKWLALVERRQEHLLELFDTGRWRHYFSQAEFDRQMRRAALLRDQWARLAGLDPDGYAAEGLPEDLPQDLPQYLTQDLAEDVPESLAGQLAEIEDEAAA